MTVAHSGPRWEETDGSSAEYGPEREQLGTRSTKSEPSSTDFEAPNTPIRIMRDLGLERNNDNSRMCVDRPPAHAADM